MGYVYNWIPRRRGETKQVKGKRWQNNGRAIFKFHEKHPSADLRSTSSPSKINEKTATLVSIRVKH